MSTAFALKQLLMRNMLIIKKSFTGNFVNVILRAFITIAFFTAFQNI